MGSGPGSGPTSARSPSSAAWPARSASTTARSSAAGGSAGTAPRPGTTSAAAITPTITSRPTRSPTPTGRQLVADVHAHDQAETHHYVVHYPEHPARADDPHYRDFEAIHRAWKADPEKW